MSDDPQPTTQHVAADVADVVREVFRYSDDRSAAYIALIEALRSEMKSGFVDTRHDVSMVRDDVRNCQDDIQETQRLQRETNGRVLALEDARRDHDAAFASIVERHNAEDKQAEDRRRLAESRSRKLHYAFNLVRFVLNNDLFVKVVGATALAALAADKIGVLP